ncbi:MAG TPA: hypothetical protein PLP88_04365, partial [Bacteroidales bacterium]|nr:hypothetical protein [Bacteroidales bacterium]
MYRHPKNPIITRHDIPPIPPQLVDVTSAFNPGAIKDDNLYRLMLRVQSRSRETFLVMAESTDGVNFTVENKIVHFRGIERVQGKIFHIYDARITMLDGRFYIMFA